MRLVLTFGYTAVVAPSSSSAPLQLDHVPDDFHPRHCRPQTAHRAPVDELAHRYPSSVAQSFRRRKG